MNLIHLAEHGLIHDALIRVGIRRLLAQRAGDVDKTALADFTRLLRQSPLAVETDAANRQHYEVPAEFFEAVLGPRLKYSCCLFDNDSTSLGEAEESMLQLTCERAEIENGMRVLELGCGWGSLTLWMAEHFPDCEITAVSNSASQRRFIEQRANTSNLRNVKVITADMRDFAPPEKGSDPECAKHPQDRSGNRGLTRFPATGEFDRVVSVETFEHMRNYELLFERVSNWLTPTGKAFVHVFCHRAAPYLFETAGVGNWMGRHFFTGGTMPSEDLFSHFADHLQIERQWRVRGMHYWRTCETWLSNVDQNRSDILARFQTDLSPREAKVHLQRWRIFFMACAELFRYNGGGEWFVAHYLFRNAAKRAHSNTGVEVCVEA